MTSHILTGWKDIANYLGRSVTTVKKYAKKYRMPIHRGPGKRPYAFAEEIDKWLIHISR